MEKSGKTTGAGLLIGLAGIVVLSTTAVVRPVRQSVVVERPHGVPKFAMEAAEETDVVRAPVVPKPHPVSEPALEPEPEELSVEAALEND